MSKSYVVIKGDTLVKIATNFYGDGTKFKIIHQANPAITNPNLINIGMVLAIPDIPEWENDESDSPKEIEVTPETIKNGVSNEVALLIDGTPFKFWSSATINFSFDTLADSFSISAPWFPDDDIYRELFRPFSYKEIVLYVGGEKVLTGNNITIKTNTNSDSKIITIDGYSKAGILADVTVAATSWPVVFRGLNLQQITESLTRPFGITVDFKSDPGPAFTKGDNVTIEPDQKIADFIISLAKQRGLIISSDKDGILVFQNTTQDAAEASIIEGRYPYRNSNVTYNGQNRFSDITAINSEMIKGAGQKYTVDDPELKSNGINRPLVWKATDTNSGKLKEAVTAKMGRTIAEAVGINVNVVDWHRIQDKKIWKDNTRVIYQSDGDMIYEETEFLIKKASLQKSPNETTTSLTLIFPETYNGEIREDYPWG